MKTRAARRPLAVPAVAGTIALLASCTTAPAQAPRPPPGPPASASASVTPFPSAVPATSLKVPGCSVAVAPARTLADVRPVMTRVPPGPFGVVTSPDGRWVFVSDARGVTVLRAGPSAGVHPEDPFAVHPVMVPAGGGPVSGTWPSVSLPACPPARLPACPPARLPACPPAASSGGQPASVPWVATSSANSIDAL